MSIGDIHGRNQWKNAIFGSIMDYEHWRNEADNNIHQFMEDQYPTLHSIDKIVFIGDYVDSFDVKNLEMKQNLEEIIHFKKKLPNKVVLLLGNHDIQYIVPDQICSGYRPEMEYDFYQLFNDNIDCFQMAYYYESEDPYKNIKRTLWTHAGVSQEWLRSAKRVLESDKFRFKKEFEGADRMRVDELLNKMWDYRVDKLYDVDGDSGGWAPIGGPLWIRPRRLVREALEGFDQVIGHTPQRTIKTMVTEKALETQYYHMIDTIFLIDCLEHGDGTVLIKDY